MKELKNAKLKLPAKWPKEMFNFGNYFCNFSRNTPSRQEIDNNLIIFPSSGKNIIPRLYHT